MARETKISGILHEGYDTTIKKKEMGYIVII